MGPPLVDAELGRQVILLEEAREPAFPVLAPVVAPAAQCFQFSLRRISVVIEVIEDGDEADPSEQDRVGESHSRKVRISAQGSIPEASVQRAYVNPVFVVVTCVGRQECFRRQVRAAQDVPNSEARRKPEQGGVDRVVRSHLHVGNRGVKEASLQVAECLPVEYLRVKFHAKRAREPFDVRHREFVVPSVVHMDRKRPQPCLNGPEEHQRTVHPAADAADAIDA